ncbi:hypothetical protein PTTG_07550 [Puccinia triticina 1-1 BBBD Race 1]|uniref:DUF4219 domain-containing protein n=1 Tax=Puccinia triticina (isolate 1-1 / race 1 (BBBD)) TaxID=630390 RepID=A0A0C4F376_PUCT1|nr:hypothetical protein PTTG_07550 [Puccinia triticina 1-1 BBBD Race 1]
MHVALRQKECAKANSSAPLSLATSSTDAEPKRPKHDKPPNSTPSSNAKSDRHGSSLRDRITNPARGEQIAMAGTRQAPAASTSATASAATNTSSSKERDLFKCPIFDGDNFPIWQRKVKMYLAVKSLLKCIKQPLPQNATQEQKQEYIRAAAILSGHYASSSVLAIYHAWCKWEDIQYDNEINWYITQLEAMLAEFAAMGLDVPATILSCTIIAQISRKRPSLMETLISNAKLLANPKHIIGKLRDIVLQ